MRSNTSASLQLSLITLAISGAEPVQLWSIARGFTTAELIAYRRALSLVMDVTGTVLRELERDEVSHAS